MPNTGRFHAPSAAAAAYRDRYMRPYSTVSPPIGAPVGASSYINRTATFRRAEEEMHSTVGSSSLYENRVRARPVYTSFDRPGEEERRNTSHIHNSYSEKQLTRPRMWAEDTALRGSVPLPAVGSVRPLESMRHSRLGDSVSGFNSSYNEATADTPSTLPCLSSLLKRSAATAEQVDNGEQDGSRAVRKRPRELVSSKVETELPAKLSRRFYDQGASTQRVQYSDSAREPSEFSHFPAVSSHALPLTLRNPITSGRSQLPSHRQPVASASSSSREYEDSPSRYSYPATEAADPRRAPIVPPAPMGRRSRAAYASETTSFRTNYDTQPHPAYEMQQRRGGYFGTDTTHQTHASMATLQEEDSSDFCSPRPTPVVKDAFSPVVRYSSSNAGERVIEAAADLVEERSPSKRESITKLLLKSKEFLKAKSLVRNRNNEIDWVATFLNVGFEANSIYSLMCPLRKGRWKVEEEKFTMELLRLIENGTIRLRHGQSIRGFIAKKLHSDDMRVLKKLSNCKIFHFARLINPRMSDEEEIDESMPNARSSLERLEKLKAEFLRSVQLEALVAVRKYLSDTSIRDLLNARD